MIELDGSGTSNQSGLYFSSNSDSSRVSGLCINSFDDGIHLFISQGVQIDGNYIGTDVTGTSALPNTYCGIEIEQSSSDGAIVGGTTPGERNVISGNTGSIGGDTDDHRNIISGNNSCGVGIDSFTGNAIQRNSIFSNTGLGIDPGDDDATPNDPDDPDEGANRLQNFPVIENVIVQGTDLQITYSVPSLPSNCSYPLSIEFYISYLCT